jgi:hypothetical protein
MIPAPPRVGPAPDADLWRAAQIVEALRMYGGVDITEQALVEWPSLERLDLDVIAKAVGKTVVACRYDRAIHLRISRLFDMLLDPGGTDG